MAIRKFGNDKPTTLDFTVGSSKKVYHIPVASDLPMDLRLMLAEATAIEDDEKRELAAQSFEYELLCRYVDQAVVKELSLTTVQEIFTAWNEVSREAGADPGE